MAKHYARLWSGNFYAEVTNDYKSTKGKKSTRLRQKKQSEKEQTRIFDSTKAKLIKKAQKSDTPSEVKKTREENLSKQSICSSCKNYDNKKGICRITNSDRGVVLRCLFFKQK